MKAWMIAAALATAPLAARAQVVTAPVLEAGRASALTEVESYRLLLPQTTPVVHPVTAEFQPKLDKIRAAVVAAKSPAELDKAKKDLDAWKHAAMAKLHAATTTKGGESLTAFETRKANEANFVSALRQQFAAQRVETHAATIGALSLAPQQSTAWNGYFDASTNFGGAPAGTQESSPRIPFVPSGGDGSVRAEQGDPKSPATYKKLRDIAVRDWGASPKIVDAAINEALRQNVDPALVLAVIWQESRFNTHATSPVGARGLMQVMPDTGRGLGVSNPDNLYDMATNLRAGVKYLRNAAAYLHLNVDLSDISEAAPNKIKALLASYNAGCGAVAKWLRQQGENLVRIPYAETRNYVKVIGDKLASLGESLGW